jgi:hypothetical protein
MIRFSDFEIDDIVVLLDNDNGISLTGIVTGTETNNAGNLIQVRVGYDKPRPIYIDDFLAKDGHKVHNAYSVVRIVGNLKHC